MGEWLRRYWHPVGLVADAADIPRKVRLLGEDLILSRDRHGRAGGEPAVIPCNGLQHFETVVDPYHVPVPHGSLSGPQFTT
jgi:phenylpropionate dioxygenase-like ring-hydroxylating dioxygenase large terminal subunit